MRTDGELRHRFEWKLHDWAADRTVLVVDSIHGDVDSAAILAIKMNDRHEIDCACGKKLRVYCEPLTSPAPVFKSVDSVRCPCGREHQLPTKPLRLLVKEGDIWVKQSGGIIRVASMSFPGPTVLCIVQHSCRGNKPAAKFVWGDSRRIREARVLE